MHRLSQGHRAPAARDGEPVTGDQKARKTEEWRTWFFFTFVMAPALAVVVVGGFGFVVWMYQLIAGPPGS